MNSIKLIVCMVLITGMSIATAASMSSLSLGVSMRQWLELGAALALVLLLIYFSAYFLKRMNVQRSAKGQGIRILSTAAVGSKEKLVLVEIAQEQVLIGVSHQGINKIHVLQKKQNKQTGKANPGQFSNYLHKVLHQDGQ